MEFENLDKYIEMKEQLKIKNKERYLRRKAISGNIYYKPVVKETIIDDNVINSKLYIKINTPLKKRGRKCKTIIADDNVIIT